MGATESTVEPRVEPFGDEFVRKKLTECNCESVVQVFIDNEIDEAAFRLLSEEDLKILLPMKLGPRKKIWTLVQKLRNEAHSESESIEPRRETSVIDSEILQPLTVNKEPHVRDTNENCSTATPPLTFSSQLLPSTSKEQEPSSCSSNYTTEAIPSELQSGISSNISDLINAKINFSTLHQSTSMQTENFDMNDQTATALTNFSSEVTDPTELQSDISSNLSDLINAKINFSTLHQSTSMQTENLDLNDQTDTALANSSSEALSSFFQKTTDAISLIAKLIPSDSDYNLSTLPKSFTNHVQLQETYGSVPEQNNDRFKIKEEKQRKRYDAEKKTELRQVGPGHRYQNYNKDRTLQSESEKANQRKHADRKGKYYQPNSEKVAVPYKISESRKKLPIYKYKEEFLNMVSQNSVVIVIAETGSGKSTQMPQYLAKANYDKKIVCTQPRRLAAKSLAKRVAIEYGSKLGTGVGYRVRFDNCTENTTKISYVTEGVLIHELATDVAASNYSVVIIDEAHERNLNTDVLLGCLKKAIAFRPNLKVIISSATVEAAKFSAFFNEAPVLDIPGRSHPVEIFYRGGVELDYLNGVVQQVCSIHNSFGLGDILVFLPGQEEIECAADAIKREIFYRPNSFVKELVLPLFSKLPAEQQNLIFEPAPPNTRKIILATNIAETSLTIDGIVYVIDCGLVKQAEYTTKAGSLALECTTLVTIPITRAQAEQRSGRAGRTQPGKAYRLYSEETYKKMAKSPVPEILRGNLEMVVLLLFSMGVKNILEFDFLDSPPRDALLTALEKLQEFGALNKGMFGEYTLTNIGRQMSGFPIEPYLSKMLIMSAELGCSEEMLTIIAMLSEQVEKLFKRPKAKKMEADMKKKTFHCEQGDHITLLTVYNTWLNNNFSRSWCNEFFLNWRTLEEVYEVRCQLSTMLDEQHIIRRSCGKDITKIQIAIASSSFRKVAWRFNTYNYYTFSNPLDEPVLIHPSSVLFSLKPDLVIYNSVTKTKKAYMNQVLAIEKEYIQEYAGTFYPKLLEVMPWLK